MRRAATTAGRAMRLAMAALAVMACGWLAAQRAEAADPGGGTSYSQAQVATLFQNSGNSYLAANAASFAAVSHNVEDTTGSTSNNNGSCCTGLMQVNQTNLTTFCGCTSAQYGQMSGADQVAVYSKYINSVQSSSSIQQLQAMQASGQSLGGQPVDGAMIAACAQLGTGNCAKAISNGCASASPADGGDGSVSICSMAAKAEAGGLVNGDGSTGTAATSGAANAVATSSSGSTMNQADIAANKCWACQAVSMGFKLADTLTSQIPDKLAGQVLVLFGTIFAMALTVSTTREVFMPIEGDEGLQAPLSLLVRFTIVMAVVMSGSIWTQFIQGYGQELAIGIGGSLGQQISTTALKAFNITVSTGTIAATP